MTAAVSPSQTDIFIALRAFILGLIDCEVVRGLGNGVPMPSSPFIAMTELYQIRLSTNVASYHDPGDASGTRKVMAPTQYVIQIDCYGPDSSDWATILTTMLRDEYGVKKLAPAAAPLHADDPKMITLVNGEENYEQRWMLTALFQFNPVVTVSQDFAGAVEIGLVNVDSTYQP